MPIKQTQEQLESLLRELCLLAKETEWWNNHDSDKFLMAYVSILYCPMYTLMKLNSNTVLRIL